MSAQDLAPHYNDVYLALVKELHEALHDIFRPRPMGENNVRGPGPERVASLERLAAECEAVGQWDRAQRLLMDSLIGCKEPGPWTSYGRFLCRKGDRPQAEEALREAIALDSSHQPALQSLTLLLLHDGATEDSLRYQEAEVVVQALRRLQEDSPEAWALMAAVYKGLGASKAQAAQNSLYESKRLAREVHGLDSFAGFVTAAEAALDLELPAAAGALLGFVSASGVEPTVDMSVCFARRVGLLAGPLASASFVPCSMRTVCLCFPLLPRCRLSSQEGDSAGALEAAKQAATLLQDPGRDVRVNLVKAEVHYAAGNAEEAAVQYQLAIQKAQATGASVPLSAYLRLGESLAQKRDLPGALKAYLIGCQDSPCAATWLGAGKAMVEMGDFGRADLALTEASALDDQNADVWGTMALVAIRQDREVECDQALKIAFKFGFADVSVLREIGVTYHAKGKYAKAEAVLRRALAAREEGATRLLLGECLVETGEPAQAKVELLKAAKALQEEGALVDADRARITGLLRRAAAELGENPVEIPERHGAEADAEGSGGAAAAAVKKPHERVMLFLGTETLH